MTRSYTDYSRPAATIVIVMPKYMASKCGSFSRRLGGYPPAALISCFSQPLACLLILTCLALAWSGSILGLALRRLRKPMVYVPGLVSDT